MELSQFDQLEEKIAMALNVINELKENKQALIEKLKAEQEKNQQLEKENDRIKSEFSGKSDNIEEAKERIQKLISKLESENLEEILK